MTSAKDRKIKPGAAHGTDSRPAGAKSLKASPALVPQGRDTDRARGFLDGIRRSGETPER